MPRGPISFGKEARDALVGQPGRSARQRGNLKPNPLFRSPARPEPSGKGIAKGRPESLLDGRPHRPRRVRPERNGRSGSRVRPVEKSRKRMVAGLPERRSQDGRRFAGKTSDRRRRSLLCQSLKGWREACFGLSRIGPQESLLFWNSIGNRPGSRDPGRNLRRGRWQHRPRFAFGDIRCARMSSPGAASDLNGHPGEGRDP